MSLLRILCPTSAGRESAERMWSANSDTPRPKPAVADFGGPGDIVRSDVGFKVPLTNEDDVVAQMEKILAELDHDRELLNRLQQQGMAYALECLM